MSRAKPGFKSSSYNCFLDLPECEIFLGHNGISGLAIEFPLKMADVIYRILSSPNADYKGTEKTIRQTLVRGGFLIHAEMDEIAFLKVLNRKERFETNSLCYFVLLTKNCNFRCSYCFVKREEEVITPEVADALVEMAAQETRGGKNLVVTWCGGEPLLHIDILLDLAKRLGKVVRKNKGAFTHAMFTNGYLLSPKVAKQLGRAGCTNAQVTIDGPKRIHDERRVLAGGKPTWERIVENITKAVDYFVINIRMNIDKHNVDYVDELMDELEAKGLRGKVKLDFAPVQSYPEVCPDVAGICFGAKIFSHWESRFSMKKIERGWGAPVYPSLVGRKCYADMLGGKTCCPDGTIVKCYNDVSFPEKAVGHLVKPEITEVEMTRNRIEWMAWDPFEKSECVKCHVLPSCMGGCLSDGMRSGNKDSGVCSTLKHNLAETIALTYYHERAVEEMKKCKGAMRSSSKQ